MSNSSMMSISASDHMRSNWGWMLALGILFIVGGFFAFVSPFFASVAVAATVAIVFIILGAAQIFQAWGVRSWGGFFWQLLVGIIILVGGIAMYINPIVAAAGLTLVVGAMFIAKGVFQLLLGFRLRPMDGWGWIAISGVLALIVGLMIVFQFPASTLYALGILAGISLAFTGWSYVMIALAGRRLAG
jgi:uncharacterized membrane protein HdeD (DUF308 family)